MAKLVKCKYCGESKSDKTIYITKKVNKQDGSEEEKKIYFCCEDCKNKYNKEILGANLQREKFLDYIQDIYVKNGYDKKQIPFTMITSQIKNMMEDNKDWNYAKMLYVLKYMNETINLNLFTEESNGSILNLLPFYFQEASEFCLKQKDIIEAVKDFEFDDEVIVIKKSNIIRTWDEIDIGGL